MSKRQHISLFVAILLILSAIVFLLAPSTPAPKAHAPAQSLDVLDGKRTVKGVPVELKGGDRASLIAFWSTRCSPCIKELPVMNQFAGKRPKISFVWVNALKDEDVTCFAGSLMNISFVHDPDSLIWKDFDPKIWGEVFAFSAAGKLLWHGSTYEITEEILSSIEQGIAPKRKKHRFAVEYSVQNDVGYGGGEYSVEPHDDGEELLVKKHSFASLLEMLAQMAYGGDVRVVALHEARAAAPVTLRVRYRCAREERREARARLLKMLCAGYDVGLTVSESRDNGMQKEVVLDYGEFSW